jgi:lipoprotein-releasing system permease protein
MNYEFQIARRQSVKRDNEPNISGSLSKVAVFGIALCVAVMIVAIAIVTGFKNEIRAKVTGFGAHIQIVNYDSNTSFESNPISNRQSFIPDLQKLNGVKNVQQFATKAGIIKTETDIQGVVFKGIGSDYNWEFFKNSMVDGQVFMVSDTAKTNKVIISKYLSRLLKLKTGDEFVMYFVQDPPRMRKFVISGIYETSVEEMDKTFILGDIAHVRKLNNWDSTQISGFEVTIRNFDDIEPMAYNVADLVSNASMADSTFLRVESIKDRYPQIFDWLNLQDMNVAIILILMLAVAGFNMISGLLILILDKTNMIGLLKALGASNKSVRKIFFYESGFLIGRGLFWGNITGIGLCLIQLFTGILKLDASSYYIDHVPINLSLAHIAILNIGTIIVTLLMLWIPSFIISRFSPADTIRYS